MWWLGANSWAEVGLDTRGQRFVTWVQPTVSGSPKALHYRRSVGDAGWSALAVVPPDDTVLRDPRLRVRPEGAALLTWHGYYAPTFEERLHATWLHLERWVDTTLDLYEYNSSPSAVALALHGGAIAAWAMPSPLGVQTAHFTAGAWSRLPSVEQDGGARGSMPTVDLDTFGTATLRWLSLEDGAVRVWNAQSAGTGWGAPELLDEDERGRPRASPSSASGRVRP